MTDIDLLPKLKQALGAMIFAADQALTVKEMRRCLRDVAKKAEDGQAAVFAKIKDEAIAEALQALAETLQTDKTGFLLQEVAGGYRFQSDPACSPWLRHLLDLGQPKRLSWPALETLAIIAYRQPATRAEIEAVRGVSVDHIVRVLMEMQLVKIVGRSELPGRPFTYGTTHTFLEHFGLKGLEDLSRLNPDLARRPEPTGPRIRQADWIEESQSAKDETRASGTPGSSLASSETGDDNAATPPAEDQPVAEDISEPVADPQPSESADEEKQPINESVSDNDEPFDEDDEDEFEDDDDNEDDEKAEDPS